MSAAGWASVSCLIMPPDDLRHQIKPVHQMKSNENPQDAADHRPDRDFADHAFKDRVKAQNAHDVERIEIGKKPEQEQESFLALLSLHRYHKKICEESCRGNHAAQHRSIGVDVVISRPSQSNEFDRTVDHCGENSGPRFWRPGCDPSDLSVGEGRERKSWRSRKCL